MRRLTSLTLLALLITAAPAAAASIKGTWKGTITVVSGNDSATNALVMKINSTKLGKKAGKVQLTGQPCKGSITLKARKGPKYVFQYHENSGDPACTGDDRITVNLVDGKLRWKGVSPDRSVVGRGTLTRQ